MRGASDLARALLPGSERPAPPLDRRAGIVWNAFSVALAATALSASPARAQNPTWAETFEGPAPVTKEIEAARIPSGSIVLDGRLDEEPWALAVPHDGFQQRGRTGGFAPRLRTVVRFAYDDEALYIGAHMETDSLGPPPALLGRRDEVGGSERILVSLDTYRDRRTSFTFGVTVSGVRVDYVQARDTEGWLDDTYDPDWTAVVAHGDDRWTAEMRIPFSQLRFSPGEEQIWGVNIRRWDPTTFLNAYWVVVPYVETGWASRFGALTGIRGVEGGAGLTVTPYLLRSTTRFTEDFGLEVRSATRVGADARVGLGSNLTIEATLNPDFGQVEADPARVNLTAFETFFPERRPFFLEGREIFRNRGPTYFYSRRIGSVPTMALEGAVLEGLESTRVLGGAKLTGRVPAGYSVGLLGALSDRGRAASVRGDAGSDQVEVTPPSVHLVGRIERELGTGFSTIGVIGTAVERFSAESGSLARLLPSRALAGGVDWVARWGGGSFETTGHLGGSRVFGSPDAIARLQRSSAHWYQRPDAEHVTLNPSRTRLTGWSAGFGLSKIGGEAWFWNVEASASSPGFEIRDAGGQTRADRVDSALGFRYLRRDPTGRLRDWTGGASISGSWNFGRVRRQTSGSAFFTGTWSNLWNTYVEVGVNDRALSDDLTRGGPLAGSPYSGTGSVRLSSPSSNRLLWSLEGSGYLDEFGGRSVTGSAGFTAFAGARVEVGVLAGRSVSVDARYPLAVLDGGPATTFGKRYVFASLERHETYGRLHVKVAFAPDAVLTGHIEPFASSGLVSDPGRLVAARGRRLLTYGTGGTAVEREQDGAWLISEDGETVRVETHDFRVRSFRGTGVFRWEWRRGSTLFLIWQRSLWRSLDRAGPAGPTELFETLQDPGQDVFAVKLSVLIGG